MEKEDPNAALFFAKCQGSVSESTLVILRKLYDFSKEAADNVTWWGNNLMFALSKGGMDLTVFNVNTKGKIMFPPSDWEDTLYADLLSGFVEKLKALPGLRDQKEDFQHWPEFSLDRIFASPEDF